MEVKLVTLVAQEVERRVVEFKEQNIAHTAWAFAKAKCSEEKKLFTAVARLAELQVCKFNAQDLANAAWAFAKLSQSQWKQLMPLARAAERRVVELIAQELAMMA